MEAVEIKPATGDVEAWGEYDGSWSLFNLQVGADPSQRQNFRVVPSTSSYQTWLPANGTCTQATTPEEVNDCMVARGVGLFQSTQSGGYIPDRSNSWQYLGPTYLTLGSDISPETLFGTGYNVSANTGREVVSVQFANNTWYQPHRDTVVAADNSLFYLLPTFGLGFGEWSFNGQVFPSFMKAVADNATIPSRSWGYTAGARYNPPGIGSSGSLVIGGYDAARIESESTRTFTISEGNLLVDVTSITIDYAEQSQGSAARTNQFKAVIDSTLPYLHLPSDICDWFAERYGLQEDTETGLFLTNSSAANANQLATRIISFVLQDATGISNNSATINLPYDAFNVVAHWSWGYSTIGGQYIFPIRRQPPDSEYAVLGRAFLQEAYVHANYEPDVMKFNISQRAFPAANTPSNLITVHATADRIVDNGGLLSSSATAGIVVGSVAGVTLIAFALWFFFIRHRRNGRKADKLEHERGEAKPYEYADHAPGDPRRGTISSTWSAAPTEIDGTMSSLPCSPRPVNARHQFTISEMSSDSDHERAHGLMATLHEAPYEASEKMDTTSYEEFERRMKLSQRNMHDGLRAMELPMTPRELPGSYDWVSSVDRSNAGVTDTEVSASSQPITADATAPPPSSSLQPSDNQQSAKSPENTRSDP